MGTHLGQFRGDGPSGGGLAELLAEVVEAPGLGRVRLSSIEPIEVTEPIQALVCGHPRVCRYLHVPLQSGASSVLERMGRPYRAEQFEAMAREVAGRCEGLCVGSDVMVGFPGETEAEFRQTVELLEGSPVAYLHVFSYSPRPGTPAAEMTGQVPAPVKASRSRTLRELSDRKWAAFGGSQVGQELQVVLERADEARPGHLEGLADNYVRVSVAADSDAVGSLRTARVLSATGGRLTGALV